MLTLLGIGQVLGDLPSSALANRLGDRRSMLVAAIVAAIGQSGCGLAPSLPVLGAALLLVGACNATFYLARQSYLADVAPMHIRARAMSTLGGSHRVGLFIGPFLGALAIAIGGLRAPFAVAVLTCVGVATLLAVIPDVDPGHAGPLPARGTASTGTVIRRFRRLFLSLGVAVLCVGAVRAARLVMLPLWAEHIGLSAATISLVFGLANAVDMALFYPSGSVMDRYGRQAIAVPSMVILGLGTMVLPLTQGLVAFAIVAMLMSFGNGIGSGIIMTLGTDAAPADNRTAFLSAWRVMSDAGNALGPVVLSLLAGALGLASGALGVGALGVVAALGLRRWAPRYSAFWTSPASAPATGPGIRGARARCHRDRWPAIEPRCRCGARAGDGGADRECRPSGASGVTTRPVGRRVGRARSGCCLRSPCSHHRSVTAPRSRSCREARHRRV
jgi:MFS family permease